MQHEAADNAVSAAAAVAPTPARFVFMADRALDVITNEIAETLDTRAMVRAASYAIGAAGLYPGSPAPKYTVAVDVSIDKAALREALAKCITVRARRVWKDSDQ